MLDARTVSTSFRVIIGLTKRKRLTLTHQWRQTFLTWDLWGRYPWCGPPAPPRLSAWTDAEHWAPAVSVWSARRSGGLRYREGTSGRRSSGPPPPPKQRRVSICGLVVTKRNKYNGTHLYRVDVRMSVHSVVRGEEALTRSFPTDHLGNSFIRSSISFQINFQIWSVYFLS